MKVVLTESQYRAILLNESRDEFTNYLSNLKEFAETVITKTEQDLKINLNMLLIWGAGVGGVMAPLNDFIMSGNFNLNEFQVASILCATSAILFNESKSTIKTLVDHIKKQGIFEVFSQVLKKGTKLRQTFFKFIESLNMTLYTISNIMSYSFIIPILPIIWEMSQSGIKGNEVKEIIVRLMSFGLVSVSGNALKELITKLVARFRD
jgi:hypothetical protein